jgi:hypothetical protein
MKLGIEDVNLIIDFLSGEPLKKSGTAISAGIAASNLSLLRLVLSSFISDLEALRHDMTTKSNHTTLAHASCEDPMQARFSMKPTVPILCGLI